MNPVINNQFTPITLLQKVHLEVERTILFVQWRMKMCYFL